VVVGGVVAIDLVEEVFAGAEAGDLVEVVCGVVIVTVCVWPPQLTTANKQAPIPNIRLKFARKPKKLLDTTYIWPRSINALGYACVWIMKRSCWRVVRASRQS
jgi:hypothetical protein